MDPLWPSIAPARQRRSNGPRKVFGRVHGLQLRGMTLCFDLRQSPPSISIRCASTHSSPQCNASCLVPSCTKPTFLLYAPRTRIEVVDLAFEPVKAEGVEGMGENQPNGEPAAVVVLGGKENPEAT